MPALTERNIVIAFDRDILLHLDIVDTFENGESVPHTCYTHFLQILMLQGHKGLADNLVLCGGVSVCQTRLLETGTIPRNTSAYCPSPRLPTKSAHSSGVHSVMIVSGRWSPLLSFPYVVGVCSFEESPSDSEGEPSSSVARAGELAWTLRSYSSSASDSG